VALLGSDPRDCQQKFVPGRKHLNGCAPQEVVYLVV
jgi:hypothetical protein